MRSRPTSLLPAAALAVAGATPALAAGARPSPDLVRDPTAYVDPLIGTRNGGNVFPGAVVPFGMLSWSPENTRGDATRTAAPGGYQYDATCVRGFGLTHMSGTGCAGGSGDIPLSPYAGEVTSSPASDTKDAVYAADFSHADETAGPGHYVHRIGARCELDVPARPLAGGRTAPSPAGTSTATRSSFHDVKVTVTSDGTFYVQPVALTVAAPGTLLAAYNNTGISDDPGDHDEADYDGGGWSYSRQDLADAGLTAGTHGTVDGLSFTWPNSPSGRPDNASATGQTIELTAPAAKLSFVGSAVTATSRPGRP